MIGNYTKNIYEFLGVCTPNNIYFINNLMLTSLRYEIKMKHFYLEQLNT